MEQETKKNLKYFAYCRKSSEGEEKQALSIETQIAKAKEIFGKLKIVEILEEKKSAFTPYNRPVFAEMIERIKRGEANGIIAWHPDRLSRNEVDAATITYMIRTGQIKDLKFGSYSFDNSPEGIMMLQMALSQSQYYSAKLGKDVKRGLEQKIKMGWKPGVAPPGYLNEKFNEKGYKTILKDPERFHLIRKMWDMLLSGIYTPPRILEIANNEWGFRTLKRKKEGGKPLARSSIYTIFTNIFYAGIIEYQGEQYIGKHEPMITLDEFDKSQEILGRKGKPRPQKHYFPFTGMIRCGECGAMITAEHKVKRQKNGNTHRYLYYHCTKRKGNNVHTYCSQRTLEVKELEKQVYKALKGIEIPKEFAQWALEVLKEENKKQASERTLIIARNQRQYNDCVQMIDSLIDMRARGELTAEDYKRRRKTLDLDRERLKRQNDRIDKGVDDWIKKAEEVFNFADDAAERFKKGDPDTKKKFLHDLGSNRLLKNRIITVEVEKPLLAVGEMAKEVNLIFERLEPVKNGLNKETLGNMFAQSPALLQRQDSNLRPSG